MNNTTELQHKETLRLETFSDGVFCIAVTLLSIEIGVEVKESITNKELAGEILRHWPIYLAYFISFVNVLLAWMGHHSLFKLLRRTDTLLMVANGVLMMLVALVPFPTRTLGEFLQTNALKTAVIFYSGYFVLISLAFRLLWYAASRERALLIKDISDKAIVEMTRNENIGLCCNLVIMGMAFISPWLALVMSFGMWIYWLAGEERVFFGAQRAQRNTKDTKNSLIA